MVLIGLLAASDLCLLAWIEADPSSDQQHWGWLKACLGVPGSIHKIGYLLHQGN